MIFQPLMPEHEGVGKFKWIGPKVIDFLPLILQLCPNKKTINYHYPQRREIGIIKKDRCYTGIKGRRKPKLRS